MLLANRVLDDDLLVVIGARADTVSYTPEMTDIALFLQRYFGRNNLLLIYPRQGVHAVPETSSDEFSFPSFTAEQLATFADPLGSATAPSPSVLRPLSAYFRRLLNSLRH